MNALTINDLAVDFSLSYGIVHALQGVSLSLKKGEVLVLAGESGSGKSVLCRSILKLLPREASIIRGSIALDGDDITSWSDRHMQSIRGRRIAMAFQDPLTILNPSMTMGSQLLEAIHLSESTLSKKQAKELAISYLERVGIREARQRLHMLPRSFSGGQRQRCALAIALAAKPDILIADEPTTALDVTIQRQILDILMDMRERLGLSILLVTHDLGVASYIADMVGIMYAGRLVEIGTAGEIFGTPRHPYTWGLLSSLPSLAQKGKPMRCIEGTTPDLSAEPHGDAFAPRNPYAMKIDYEKQPPWFKVTDTHYAAAWLLDERAPHIDPPWPPKKIQQSDTPADTDKRNLPEVLCINHVSKCFMLDGAHRILAVDDVSFSLHEGEIMGLLGESGSGKSTLARLITGMYAPSSGRISFCGKELSANREKETRQKIQMIFQDADGALNPYMTAGESIMEGLRLTGMRKSAATSRAKELLDAVELSSRCFTAYPSELSGGQKQRVTIARCLGMKPRVVVADEPVAALDVSIQAQIINLLCRLQKEQGFAMIFIAHDISVVRYISDWIAVMKDGRLIEQGSASAICTSPREAYTRRMLSSVLEIKISR